jgi:enoyl-[acyl-carrier-protein] reductase (NADH)
MSSTGDDQDSGCRVAAAEGCDAEDIAEVLVWFLESARLITGETLIVDSGIHIGKLPPYSSGDSY